MIDGGLRTIFSSNLRDFQWTAIETGTTISGVPDAEFCSAGIQGWIEYKATETHKITQTDKTKFQISWHERRHREGGRTFIGVRRWHDGGPRKGAAVDELWMFRGADIRAIYTQGLLETTPLLWVGGGPGKWPWPKVRQILLSSWG